MCRLCGCGWRQSCNLACDRSDCPGAVLLVKRDYALCACCLFCNSLFVHRYESGTGRMVRSTARTINVRFAYNAGWTGRWCLWWMCAKWLCVHKTCFRSPAELRRDARKLLARRWAKRNVHIDCKANKMNGINTPYTVHTCTLAREKTITTTITHVQSRVVHKCYVIESPAIYQPFIRFLGWKPTYTQTHIRPINMHARISHIMCFYRVAKSPTQCRKSQLLWKLSKTVKLIFDCQLPPFEHETGIDHTKMVNNIVGCNFRGFAGLRSTLSTLYRKYKYKVKGYRPQPEVFCKLAVMLPFR